MLDHSRTLGHSGYLPRPPSTTPQLYAQDGLGYDAEVHAHYFIGAHDWFVTEYDPEEDTAFGWACLNHDRQNAELGYFSVQELDAIRVGPGRLFRVELEDPWTPKPLTQAIALLDSRQGLRA